MSLHNAQKLSTLAAVGLMLASATADTAQPEPKGMRYTDADTLPRRKPQPPRMVTASSEEIRAWNAAVDAKKAEKRARRAMKGQS